MSFDGIVTKNIVNELQNTIIDGKINKIFEPNKNEIIIGTYAHGSNYCLNLSIASNSYRANLTTNSKPNPLNAPSFCMLLRKHLVGGKITNIYTNGLERIIYININCYNELNDLVEKKLIIELMGKHSNIILTNSNNTIIDSLRHLSTEENSTRDILPAREYVVPENKKIDFCSLKSFDDFNKLFTKTEKNLDSSISQKFMGISKLFVQYTTEKLNLSNMITGNSLKKMYEYINKIINNSSTDNLDFVEYKGDFVCTLKDNSSPLHLNFFIDDFYTQKETIENFTSYRNNLLKLVSSTLSKIKKKAQNINNKIEECKKMDQYKLYGEILTANLYKFTEFTSDTVELINYYDNNPVTVPVNQYKTPSYNVKNYFKKYNKLKNALEIVNKQKKETMLELDYLESIIYEISAATQIQDIDEIYTEITESELFAKKTNKSNAKIKRQKIKNKRLDKNYVPIKYKIEDFTLLVGKNNMQNDYLTTKVAKNSDLWFHTKEIHGSHAILQTSGKEPSIDVIIRCAEIAAYYSKARLSSNVPVDYTYIKYVKKPSGSKPRFCYLYPQ